MNPNLQESVSADLKFHKFPIHLVTNAPEMNCAHSCEIKNLHFCNQTVVNLRILFLFNCCATAY